MKTKAKTDAAKVLLDAGWTLEEVNQVLENTGYHGIPLPYPVPVPAYPTPGPLTPPYVWGVGTTGSDSADTVKVTSTGVGADSISMSGIRGH